MEFVITLSHDEKVLESLRDEWGQLHENSNATGIYLTWHWVNLWWKHHHNKGRLWLLQARAVDDNRLIGIAPLMRVHHRPKHGIGWRQIQFISALSPCEHLDFIIEQGHEEPVIATFIQHILDNKKHWDVLHIARLIDGTSTLTVLDSLDYHWEHGEPLIAPVITLPDNWDDYFNSLSKNKRWKQRRYRKELDERYPDNWSFDYVIDENEIDATFDKLIQLHQSKWEAEGEIGAFGDPQIIHFLREVAHEFFKLGWLRLYRLIIDKQIAASLFGYQYRGRFYYYAIGFDHDFADLNPGHILNELMIQQSIADGLKEYDFLWGDESYKYSWQAHNRLNHVRILRKSLHIKAQEWIKEKLRGAKHAKT